jgi:hypothetical protein
VWVVMCYVMSTFTSVRPAAIPRGRIDLLPTHVRPTHTQELGSPATSISGDSRLILLGCSDGTVAALSWSGKVS